MLKSVAGLIAFVCVSLCAAADAVPEPVVWKTAKLPPEAADKALRGIYFLDDKRGWIVGDKGLCLTTGDGGATWTVLPTGSDAILRAVRFNDAEHGFICGDGDSEAPRASGHVVMGLRPMKSSSVLTTEDGGKTWKKNWVPCNFEVWCIETSAAPTLQVGVGCPDHLDGDITRSGDAGATWKERRVFRALSDIRAVDEKRWVAVGSPVSVSFTGGKITDPNYLAKKCRALYSDDGGKTWMPSKGSDGSSVLRALLVKKDQPMLAVGDGGALLCSTDNGENWESVKNPDGSNLRAIAAATGTPAILAAGKYGRLILSSDGGKTWRCSWVGHMQYVHGVAACGSTFWCVGAGGIAVYCDAKTLTETKDLPVAPEPPKPAVKPAEPVKKATDAQRARVKVGDYLVYAIKLKVPSARIDSECEVKQTITAVTEEEFTMTSEVLKGTPPPGMPEKNEEKFAIGELDDYSDLAVDKSKEEKSGQITLTTVRTADETVNLKDTPITCRVFKSDADVQQNIHLTIKQWMNTDILPVTGILKAEVEQTITTPAGTVEKITRTQVLMDWGRAAAPATIAPAKEIDPAQAPSPTKPAEPATPGAGAAKP